MSREMGYRVLPDEILETWNLHDIKEFWVYQAVAVRESNSKR